MYRYIVLVLFFLSINVFSAKLSDHNEMASSLMKEKKYNDAIEFLLRISEKKYNYFSYHILAESHRYLGEYKKSLSYYKRSVSMFDAAVSTRERAIIHSALAYVYSKLGEYDLAIVDYLKSLNYLPDNYIILSNLAKSYLNLGDHKNAIKYFDKSLELNSSYTVALKGMGKVYFELGLFKKSLFFYNKVIEFAPNLSDGYFGVGYNLERLGKDNLSYRAFAKANFLSRKYSESISFVKKLSYKDNKGDYLLLISAYIYLKDYRAALSELNKAIILYRGDEDFIFTKAQVFFFKKDYKRSVSEALLGIKLFPNSYNLYALLGRSYSELSDNDKAILYYNKALWLKEDDVNTRERLAHIYRQIGKEDLEFFHQGVVYFFLGDYLQSSKVLDWINVSTFGHKASLNYYKGMVLWASDKRDEAIKLFKVSISKDDSLYLPYLALARGYDELGNRDKSINLLESYIDKYPKSYHIGELRSLLSDLKSK